MKSCAETRGQTPVRIDHKSGAASVVGWLSNFQRKGQKLVADFYVLESHAARAQILETAQRMPTGVGLSASFVSPDEPEFTDTGMSAARCSELVSVDWVALPACNPNGLFSAIQPPPLQRPRPRTGSERAVRVLRSAAHGAEIGSLTGTIAGTLLRGRPGFPSTNTTAGAGALAGGLLAGAARYRADKLRDAPRDMAARVGAIMLERAEVQRLTDAVANNVSLPEVPYADQAQTIRDIAKKPLARRVAVKVLKVGAGAAAGYYAGRKIGPKAGAAIGATAGLFLERNPDVRRTIELAVKRAK